MSAFKTKYILGTAIIGVALTLPYLNINSSSVSAHLAQTSSSGGDDSSVSSYLSEMKDNYSNQVSALRSFHGVKVNDLSDSETGRELLFKPKVQKYISFDGKAYKPILSINPGMARTILSMSVDASAQGFL